MNALSYEFGGEVPLIEQAASLPAESEESWFSQRINGWPVRRKLRFAIFGIALVPFATALMLLFFIGYFGELGANQSKRTEAELIIAEAALVMSQVSYDIQRVNTARDPAMLIGAKEEAEKANVLVTQAMFLAQNRYPEEIVAQLAERQRTLELCLAELNNLTISDTAEQYVATQEDMARQSVWLSDAFGATSAFAKREIADLLGMIKAVFAICLGIVVIVGAMVILGGSAIVSNVSEAISWMKRALESLAKGDTRVTIPGADRRDELGAIARALGIYRQSALGLQDLTRERACAAEEALDQAKISEQLRNEKAEALRRLADDFEDSILASTRFVAEASGQLQSTSSEMAHLAEQSSGHVTTAASAMEQAAIGVSATASASDQFALSIDEISQQAAASAALARGVKCSVEEANDNIEGLSRSVDQIGEIAEMIGSIAARTNLLSLNASIEAARGGEAGRGFAVVAAEVKELAGRTAHATNNVAAMIESIRGTTRDSVDGLASVSKQIANLEQSAVSIAAAVDEQSVSGRELASSIDDVAVNSGDVSQTLGEVRQSALTVGSAAVQMLKSSEDTQCHAEQLREQALQFLEEVREGYRALDKPGNATS